MKAPIRFLATHTIALVLAASAISGEIALYDEPFRPQFHFTPEINWMNDPNGLVYFDGEYHLFYQHNPHGNNHGHISWGHAVSSDLVRWEQLPVAIPEQGDVMAFSGSAVVDWNNTSGFGNGDAPPLVAVYTGHRTTTPAHQSQYLAFSNDRGRTWTPYSGNPVLDLGLSDFRDPKVFWYAPGEYWIMAVVLAAEGKVAFYRSADLKGWTLLSHFGPAGATGGVWECPDLFPLPDPDNSQRSKWVLIVNMNPGALQGGSGCQYFIGDFDGTTFTADKIDGGVLTKWADYGQDFYAAVSWSDIPEADGRRIWIGWMNNWDYCQEIPTHPWRSAQSIPRSLSLVRKNGDLLLAQTPVKELEKLRGEGRRLNNIVVDKDSVSLAEYGIEGDSYEIAAEVEAGDASAWGFSLRSNGRYQTLIGYDARKNEMYVDRGRSGIAFHDTFKPRQSYAFDEEKRSFNLRIFVDRSSVEVFLEDGTLVFTDQVFPQGVANDISFYSENGRTELKTLQFWKLNTIWKHKPATPKLHEQEI